MTKEISTSEAIGEIRTLSRVYKALVKGEEILNKLSGAEKQYDTLQGKMIKLEQEKADLDLACDKVYNKKEELTKHVETLDEIIKEKHDAAIAEAARIVKESQDQASAIITNAENEVDHIKHKKDNAVKAYEKVVNDLHAAEQEFDSFKEKVEAAKQKLIEGVTV